MLVENGKVKVNRFGTLDLTPTPLKARTFHEVAHWEDLNQNWLSKYQFIDWRFPDPLERLKPDWVIPSEFRALARLGEALIQQGSKGKKGRPQSLPEDEVARLIQMRKDKPTLSQDSLADEFKVTRGTIRNILKKYGKN
jgi:hypothetical protein